MGLDFRFHPKACAAFQEEFKSFRVRYFRRKFVTINDDIGFLLDSC